MDYCFAKFRDFFLFQPFWYVLLCGQTDRLKPGFHSNAIACHCFDRAFLLAGACVCFVKISHTHTDAAERFTPRDCHRRESFCQAVIFMNACNKRP